MQKEEITIVMPPLDSRRKGGDKVMQRWRSSCYRYLRLGYELFIVRYHNRPEERKDRNCFFATKKQLANRSVFSKKKYRSPEERMKARKEYRRQYYQRRKEELKEYQRKYAREFKRSSKPRADKGVPKYKDVNTDRLKRIPKKTVNIRDLQSATPDKLVTILKRVLNGELGVSRIR